MTTQRERREKEEKDALRDERAAEREEKRAEKEEQQAEKEERKAEGHEAVLASRPTPTPEEQDAFARGERNVTHEPDGSPEMHSGLPHPIRGKQEVEEDLERDGWKKAKDAEPESGASYKTRQASPDKKGG
jgi:hypothetical protein